MIKNDTFNRNLMRLYIRNRKYHIINCPKTCIRYNKAWHRKTGIPIRWIRDAGHNSNTDQPEIVNGLIEEFVGNLNQQTGQERETSGIR